MARLAVPGMDLWFNAPFGQLEKHRPEGGRFSWNERREGIGSSGRCSAHDFAYADRVRLQGGCRPGPGVPQ